MQLTSITLLGIDWFTYYSCASVGCSGLAFVANRNLSPQVGLFSWSLDSVQNEAALIEILNDAWSLHIDSQGAKT